MKWFLFLIPLLFYSLFADGETHTVDSSSSFECASRPVLYGVGMHNYWNDSSGITHAYYDGCEYIQKGVAFETPSTGYFGDWYPTGSVMPEPGQGSGSHPGNASGSVDLSSMGSPLMDFANLKTYKKKGNTSSGQSKFLYNGSVYSVSYNAAKDVTTYTPLSYDPEQRQLFDDYTDSVDSSTDSYIESLSNSIKNLVHYRSVISSYIESHTDEKYKYFNDYQSAVNLVRVYSQLISSAQMDISRIKNLGYNPSSLLFDDQFDSEYYIVTDKGSFFCSLSFSYCDIAGKVKLIVYHNKADLKELEEFYNLSGVKFKYSKSSNYKLFTPSFNFKSATYFLSFNDGGGSSDFFTKPSNAYLRHIIFNSSLSPPFMDFTQSSDDSGSGDSGQPDTGDSDSGDSGNPDTGDSGSGDTSVTTPGDSGHGTVTPPHPGGGGSGGTDTPDTGSQCAPGSPGWPDCDDQSGQPGGGDNPGDSGSGGDRPGTGDSGSGDSGSGSGSPSTGGSGGGHGSGGDGQGGGDTDGDGDALLQEVKRFHADVNAALHPDVSAFPQFDDTDADFSDVQKDIDKRFDEENSSWSDEASRMENVLGSITGSLPSTNLDMSGAVPPGITGVCRPWEFDIVIGITDSKQFKQHVVMNQFCTWYDTYIRPFVTWAFNFLTAVAVFNILYKGLRTLN